MQSELLTKRLCEASDVTVYITQKFERMILLFVEFFNMTLISEQNCMSVTW